MEKRKLGKRKIGRGEDLSQAAYRGLNKRGKKVWRVDEPRMAALRIQRERSGSAILG